MIRTFLLFIALLVAVPTFAQSKQATPAAQEQLMELRLQQHLDDEIEKKLTQQKADLEEKLEVRKDNLNYQREQANDWITLFGLVVTVIGIILPIVMFFMGKRVVADVHRQKKDADRDLDKLKEDTKTKLDSIVREAEKELQRIKEIREANELIRIASEAASKEGTVIDEKKGEDKQKFDFSQQADKIDKSEYATPFQKAMAKALELFFAENYEESIKMHKTILDEFKSELTLEDLPNIYFRLAFSYGEQKDQNNAIIYYERSLSLNPTDYVAWNNLGIAYNSKGDYDIAISKYEEAIRLKLDNAFAWNNLGIAYNSKGDYDIAISKYEEAIRLKPDYADAWNNLGNAYLRKGNYDTAISKYEEAIRLRPDYALAWNNLGNAYNSKGDYDTAISKYEEAIRLKPDYALALSNLAELLIIQNRNASEILSKLEGASIVESETFNYLLLNSIFLAKNLTYSSTVDNALRQLQQAVGGDARKVKWDYKEIKEWLAREEATPAALTQEARVFIAELIRRIEEWRNGSTTNQVW